MMCDDVDSNASCFLYSATEDVQMNDTAYVSVNASTAQQRTAYMLPAWLLPPLGILLACLSLFTVVSNVFVVVAVVRERFLRTVTNSFILSLSLADLIMGLVVMPLAIVYDLSGGVWNMGALVCDFWKASEVLSGLACIGNIALISLDRYIAVVYPIQYRRGLSRRKAAAMILAVWFIAVCLSFPCILWWHATNDIVTDRACEFTQNARNYLVTALSSLLFLAVVFLFAYFRIYLIATRQMKNISAGRRRVTFSGISSARENVEMRIHRGGSGGSSNSDSAECREGTRTRRARRLLTREYKTAQIVGIVILTFFICWLPFIVAQLRLSQCDYRYYCLKLPYAAFRFFKWLIYTNSALNPLIYARGSDNFRHAYRRIWWSLLAKLPLVKKRRSVVASYQCAALQRENSIPSECPQCSNGRTETLV